MLAGIAGSGEVEISRLCADSRATGELPGSLFFCVPGERFDGHRYAPKAVEGGAAALVVERILDGIDVPQVQVSSIRSAMALIAGRFYGDPASKMKMFALTGTKGKTTTSYLVKSILEAAGMKVGLIGTIGCQIGQKQFASSLTTPDPLELHRTLRYMLDEGAQAVVMEASAHALDMHRLDGICFEGAAYTNLSQDHLDYFHDMRHYAEAKKKLFTPELCRNCAFNADDETAKFMMEGVGIPSVTYGISAENCTIVAREIEALSDGFSYLMRVGESLETRIHLHLTGIFNVYNAMAAAALGMIAGATMDEVRSGLEAVYVVPGRVEVLDTHTSYKVILDYSHSPAALENILKTARQFTRGKVIVLFGCGGDRDREKRPIMGKIAGTLADYSILTSDNPRNEDPFDILRSIEQGIAETRGEYCVIENRREAIRFALENAKEEDTVILAGKGHEKYQEINGVKRPFDEKEVVSRLLDEIRAKAEG